MADGDAQLASLLDGFTATVRADTLGWSFEIAGASDTLGEAAVFTNNGSWVDAGTSFQNLFGGDTSWHAVTSNQLVNVGTHTARFERIRLVAGSEVPPQIIEVSPELDAGELLIRWDSVEGRRYQVDKSTDLKLWINLDTVPAGGRIGEFTDTVVRPPMSFYRIRLL